MSRCRPRQRSAARRGTQWFARAAWSLASRPRRSGQREAVNGRVSARGQQWPNRAAPPAAPRVSRRRARSSAERPGRLRAPRQPAPVPGAGVRRQLSRRARAAAAVAVGEQDGSTRWAQPPIALGEGMKCRVFVEHQPAATTLAGRRTRALVFRHDGSSGWAQKRRRACATGGCDHLGKRGVPTKSGSMQDSTERD